MEESELHAAGKQEGPIRLGRTKARREVTKDTFTGKKDKKKKERKGAPTHRALSLCLDPNSCLKANTF